MADVQTYLLRWDFDKFRDQISNVQSTYTKFGSALKDLVSSVSTDLTGIQQRATMLSVSLGTVTSQVERSVQAMREGSSSANQLMESIARNGAQIATSVARIPPGGHAGKGQVPPALAESEAQVEAVKGSAAIALEMANSANEQVLQALRDIEENKRRTKAELSSAEKYFKAEMEHAGGIISGTVNSASGGITSLGLKGGAVTGVLGSLLGAMIFGYEDTNRIKALSGEVLNVFEATGEDWRTKAAEKTRSFFSGKDGFVERAQWFYHITKEESLSVLKSMVDAGYKSKQIAASANKSLGEVGENVAVMSIGIDKHFNQDTGTSINNMIKISSSFGDSLKKASDKYMLLAFAGQRSGMGISKFVDSVISGASAMQQYGIDVKDVANIMGTLKKHYQDMGLNPQYAGERASQAVSGLMNAMATMSPGMKAQVMQQLTPGLSALDARQAFEDGFRRVLSGENKNFASRVAGALYQYATAGGKDRNQAILILESQAGMQNQTAATLVDTKGEVAKVNVLTKLTQEEMKNLRESLITEGEQTSELEKTQRDLKNALATIGHGILKVLVSLVGLIASGFKGIMLLVGYVTPGSHVEWADIEKFSGKIERLEDYFVEGLSESQKGFSELPDILKKQFGTDFQPVIDALKSGKKKEGGVEEMSIWDSVGKNIERFKAWMAESDQNILNFINDPEYREQVVDMVSGDVKEWWDTTGRENLRNAAYGSQTLNDMASREGAPQAVKDMAARSNQAREAEKRGERDISLLSILFGDGGRGTSEKPPVAAKGIRIPLSIGSVEDASQKQKIKQVLPPNS